MTTAVGGTIQVTALADSDEAALTLVADELRSYGCEVHASKTPWSVGGPIELGITAELIEPWRASASSMVGYS